MPHTERRKIRYSDRFALVWSAVIGYLSLTPLPVLPEIGVSDKLEHFAAYGLLGFLAVLARRSTHGIVWVSLAIVAYGSAIEIVQPYVNRYMELGDFVANISGTLFGAMLGLAARRVVPESR